MSDHMTETVQCPCGPECRIYEDHRTGTAAQQHLAALSTPSATPGAHYLRGGDDCSCGFAAGMGDTCTCPKGGA